ncbi:MAG: hypothetical protein V3R60_00385 [Acidobacteriota bacterium]
MLRITRVAEVPSTVTLKLEGRIATDWVFLLKRECLRSLHDKQKVTLDFSEGTFIDGRGAEMLKRIESGTSRSSTAPLSSRIYCR